MERAVQEFSKLLPLFLAEPKLISHLLSCFMNGLYVQNDLGYFLLLLFGITLFVLRLLFFLNLFGFRPIGYLIHLPEDLCQGHNLLLIQSGHFLRIIRIRVHLHGID